MSNRFIKLPIKHYSLDGLALRNIDEEAAKEHYEWLDTWVDVSQIERFSPFTGESDNTLIHLRSGDEFTTKGSPEKVFERVMKFADNNI